MRNGALREKFNFCFFLLVFIEFLFWLGDWVYRGPKYISTNRFQIHSTFPQGFHAPSVTFTVTFIAGYHCYCNVFSPKVAEGIKLAPICKHGDTN